MQQRALDDARSTLAELRTQSSLADELTRGDRLKAWPTLSTQDKRRLLEASGSRRRLACTRSGKNANPVSDRAQIVLRGNVLVGENRDEIVR